MANIDMKTNKILKEMGLTEEEQLAITSSLSLPKRITEFSEKVEKKMKSKKFGERIEKVKKDNQDRLSKMRKDNQDRLSKVQLEEKEFSEKVENDVRVEMILSKMKDEDIEPKEDKKEVTVEPKSEPKVSENYGSNQNNGFGHQGQNHQR